MRSARTQRGFTLLEILVAFMVLALVGGALLEMFQGGMKNLSTADSYSRAALLAESTLSQLRAEPQLSPGERSGELEPGFDYHLSLVPYVEDGVPDEQLLDATVTVTWGQDATERSYRLRTLLLPAEGQR